MIVGAALVAAGTVVAVVGSIAPDPTAVAAVVPFGGSFLAVGTFAIASGVAAISRAAQPAQ